MEEGEVSNFQDIQKEGQGLYDWGMKDGKKVRGVTINIFNYIAPSE